jgi:hypothetical protein
MALIILSVYLSFKPEEDSITKDALRAWIQVGYAKQFCNVIYPNVANCLTIDPNQCISFANQQLEPCIDSITKDLSATINSEDSKTIYKSVSRCFEENMRKGLLEKYLVNTKECKDKFL